MHLRPLPFALPLVLAAMTAAPLAQAFCGFYVSGADAKLFNNATVVVLMREGTRTVLSMQNNYQGPTDDFAMVVPVPVVLNKDNVKTLPNDIFARVDRLTAPRLVEYWEQDPCTSPDPTRPQLVRISEKEIVILDPKAAAAQFGVKVEARFTAGEYDIAILSAKNSLGLEAYLHAEKYKIPSGAAQYLRPYVAQGSKFFVAKVDSKKVKFQNGQAQLSPLRFHYDSETFSLPVRLGLINSAGTQDLIVVTLGKMQYEVANYPNTMIPTNLRVNESVKSSFGAFYTALFDKTLEDAPRSIVTEYAWSAGSCDPCPEPPLKIEDLSTLGMDVLPSTKVGEKVLPQAAGRFTITRLHARYEASSLGEDLVFRESKGASGGTGVPKPDGTMQEGAVFGYGVSFQGRYVILHSWTGPVACKEPHRGFWGGPLKSGAVAPTVATNTAFVPRGATLASFWDTTPAGASITLAPVSSASSEPPKPAPSLAEQTNPPMQSTPEPRTPPASGGCASCAVGEDQNGFGAALGVLVASLAGLWRRRKRTA